MCRPRSHIQHPHYAKRKTDSEFPRRLRAVITDQGWTHTRQQYFFVALPVPHITTQESITAAYQPQSTSKPLLLPLPVCSLLSGLETHIFGFHTTFHTARGETAIRRSFRPWQYAFFQSGSRSDHHQRIATAFRSAPLPESASHFAQIRLL